MKGKFAAAAFPFYFFNTLHYPDIEFYSYICKEYTIFLLHNS